MIGLWCRTVICGPKKTTSLTRIITLQAWQKIYRWTTAFYAPYKLMTRLVPKINLSVSLFTHPSSLLAANKCLCVCDGIRVTPRRVSLTHPHVTFWLLLSLHFHLFSVAFAIRHEQLNISRFFTQGGGGERLPPDSHQQSHRRQRGQSQGPRYCLHCSTVVPLRIKGRVCLKEMNMKNGVTFSPKYVWSCCYMLYFNRYLRGIHTEKFD